MTSAINSSESAVTTQKGLLSPASNPKVQASTIDRAESKRLNEAARQFEAVFLRQMLSCLEKTTSMQGAKQAGSNLYGSMMVDAVADAVSRAGGIGLAAMLTKTLEPQLASRTAVLSETHVKPNTPEQSSAETKPLAGRDHGGAL